MPFLRFQYGTSNLGFDANAFTERHCSTCSDQSENLLCTRHSGNAGRRSCPTLWCCDKKPKQSREAKRKPVSFRFHVPTFTQGTAQFGVPVWNLKTGPRRSSLCSVCFHGARCGDAFQRTPQFASRSGKRRDHANLRSASRNAHHTRRIAPKN